MKNMKTVKLFVLLICTVFVASCATVKEEENKEEINLGVSGLPQELLDLMADTTMNQEELLTALFNLNSDEQMTVEEVMSMLQNSLNSFVKEYVTVFPNPTSSSARINVDLFRYMGMAADFMTYDFRYDLIFDGRIIHTNEVKNITKWEEVIPAHLLQNSGVYVVAYEIHIETDMGMTKMNNTVNFMVVKKQ